MAPPPPPRGSLRGSGPTHKARAERSARHGSGNVPVWPRPSHGMPLSEPWAEGRQGLHDRRGGLAQTLACSHRARTWCQDSGRRGGGAEPPGLQAALGRGGECEGQPAQGDGGTRAPRGHCAPGKGQASYVSSGRGLGAQLGSQGDSWMTTWPWPRLRGVVRVCCAQTRGPRAGGGPQGSRGPPDPHLPKPCGLVSRTVGTAGAPPRLARSTWCQSPDGAARDHHAQRQARANVCVTPAPARGAHPHAVGSASAPLPSPPTSAHTNGPSSVPRPSVSEDPGPRGWHLGAACSEDPSVGPSLPPEPRTRQSSARPSLRDPTP